MSMYCVCERNVMLCFKIVYMHWSPDINLYYSPQQSLYISYRACWTIVFYSAVIRVVTQRFCHTLRDDPNDGWVGD